MIQDIMQSPKWPIGVNPLLLNNKIDTNQQKLYTNAENVLWIDQESFEPIDAEAVIVFDVIDHIEEEPFMDKLLPLCKNKEIHFRVHPYTSRLATHDTQRNKALSHLFTHEGIRHNKKTVSADYIRFFKKYKLEVVSQEKHYQEIEDFFYAPLLRKQIEAAIKMKLDDKQAEVQFIDYHLVLT